MATASTPTSATASTSGACDAPAASSSCPAAVCLIPFRCWAGVWEEAAEEGGVRYAATPAASPSYYGLRLLHSFLHPDLVLRLDRGERCAGVAAGGSLSYALVPADELSRALTRMQLLAHFLSWLTLIQVLWIFWQIKEGLGWPDIMSSRIVRFFRSIWDGWVLEIAFHIEVTRVYAMYCKLIISVKKGLAASRASCLESLLARLS